jgi:hypothetical protein
VRPGVIYLAESGADEIRSEGHGAKRCKQ